MSDNGWFIPDSNMSTLALEMFMEMMNIICKGGSVDVMARKDGKSYLWECDGLKYAIRIHHRNKHSLPARGCEKCGIYVIPEITECPQCRGKIPTIKYATQNTSHMPACYVCGMEHPYHTHSCNRPLD